MASMTTSNRYECLSPDYDSDSSKHNGRHAHRQRKVKYADIDWTNVRRGNNRNSDYDRSESDYGYRGRDTAHVVTRDTMRATHNTNDSRTIRGRPDHERQQNYKTIRCLNMLANRSCTYGGKCKYAHSLEEQNIVGPRRMALDVILKQKDLSNIDISSNKKLYGQLKCMTALCQKCIDSKCTGGYNCKHGACNPKCVVCLEDMNKGTCKQNKCDKIHLTDRGLIPYGIRITHESEKDRSIKPVLINDVFFESAAKHVSSDVDDVVDDDEDILSIASVEEIVNDSTPTEDRKDNKYDDSEDDNSKCDNNGHNDSEHDNSEHDDSEGDNANMLDEIDVNNSEYKMDILLSLISSTTTKPVSQIGSRIGTGSEYDLANMMSTADSSSDSFSFSDSESDEMPDIVLLTKRDDRIGRSIFGVLPY